RGRRPRALLVILAGAAVFVAGFLGATQIRFRSLPRNLFFQEDPMGRALGFLDTRFGGADLLQIGVRGDFSDPRDASHLLRLTDCLEGTGAFSDVRSVGQVLALLGKGFFGLYRVPREPEALAQLWSFLEGNEDIRALVTEDRDEAMIAARIHPSRMGDLEGLLLAARAAESCALGEPREVAQARLDALRRRYLPARPPGSVQASLDVLEAPPPPSGMFREALLVRLRGYMASPESAFAPSEPEWEAMAEVLASDGDVTGRLARTIEGLAGFRSMGYPQEVATRVAADLLALSGEAERTRVIDLALAELAGTGDPGSPELIDRARGVLADLRDRLPTTKGGRVTISGTPAVAEAVQGPMAIGIVQGAAIIWALLCLVTWAVTRRTRSFIVVSVEVGVATLYTFALGWLLDVQMDPVCAPLYLVPPLVGFFVSPWIHRLDSELCPVGNRQVAAFVLALAGGALGLMLSGVLPMLRVGAVVALGLGLVILSSTFFRRIAA
ncbi:MAG: hypothetical protein FJ098_15215, partial [Deltaproteobacteria bacterium]|nr:hypothetical protein [Deltaproteobacteria bacterium]